MSPALQNIIEVIIKEFAEKLIEVIEGHIGSQPEKEDK